MPGTHRQSSASPFVVGLGVVAVIVFATLGALLFFYFRHGNGVPLPPRGTPEFSFDLQRARSVSVGKRPRPRVHRRTVTEVHELMDGLYRAGFLDPEQWQGGEFTTYLEGYAGQAARAARRDLGALTVVDAAAALDRVTPEAADLRVIALYQRRRAVAAVALTTFRATADVTAGGRTPVEHEGRYILRLVKGRWAVVGYQVKGRIGDSGATQEAEGGRS